MNGGHSKDGQPEDGQPLEEQLARCAPAGAPPELRGVVLHQIHRELRAARWDRRMVRAAAVLFAVGIGANGLIQQLYPLTQPGLSSTQPSPQTIGRLAATVAEVTDMATARHFVRQMVARKGWSPQSEEMEIIRRGFQPPQTHPQPHGKDG